MAYEQSLIQAGLTKDQAALYEALVEGGPLPASRAARKSGVPRTLAYRALAELSGLGLVEKKDEPGKVAVFAPAHPLKLEELVERKRREADGAKEAVSGILAKLISDFNAVLGQPGIRIAEGVVGVAELYADVLKERQDILLLRSPLDEEFPELAELVAKQIKDQVRLGIHTRALTPLVEGARKSYLAHDERNLVARRVIPRERFDIPAQILIYGNKVALTSYEKPLMTTIIENPAIKATCVAIFEYVWTQAEAYHQGIVEKWRSEALAA